MGRVALSMLLFAACDGLVLLPGNARLIGSRGAAVMSEGAEAEATQSKEYRAAQAAEQAATAERRRSQVSEMAFSTEETDALTKASKSLQSCWTGKPENCPASLKNIFTQQPKDLFAVLRNPLEEPAPEAWECIREKWPVLAGRTDEELLSALQPIKDVKVDRRYLKFQE